MNIDVRKPMRPDDSKADLTPLIRDLTNEEITFFKKNGWVYVPRYIDPRLAEEVRQHYKAWSGLRWDEWPADPQEQKEFIDICKGLSSGARKIMAIRQDDPWMFNFVTQRQLGKAAAELLSVPSIKPYSETLQVKYPSSSGYSAELHWHSDWPNMSVDRCEAVQTWFALADITADMGTMTHLSGSHVEPPRGMHFFAGEDAREVYPDLWEKYEQTTPRDYAQGDAIFHHCLTYHSSGSNATNKIRWAMSNLRMSGRCLYTGQPNVNTDGLGLIPNKHFEHPNFPTIYP